MLIPWLRNLQYCRNYCSSIHEEEIKMAPRGSDSAEALVMHQTGLHRDAKSVKGCR